MTRRDLLAAAVAACAAAVVYFSWGKGPPPGPEELIRRHVGEMARAAEARDVGALMERISADFSAPEFGDRDALRGLLAALLLRGEWVRAWPVDVRVALKDGRAAHATLRVVLGRSTSARLEDLGKDTALSGYRMELDWKREGEAWRITSATARELSPTELITL
ncbi:MAG: hypothetical protein FJ086_18680 [Deltaproteobacteria bacterium]|nr:hypothetical protein [Deltaproteobacteria bacterium]